MPLNLNNIRRGWQMKRSNSSVYREPTDEELAKNGQFRIAPDEARFISEIPIRKTREPEERPPIISPYGEFLEGLVGE